MAIYSFSTHPVKKKDTIAVDLLKLHCEREGLNFSKMVIAGVKLVLAEKGIKYD